jgi:hypothetical protein
MRQAVKALLLMLAGTMGECCTMHILQLLGNGLRVHSDPREPSTSACRTATAWKAPISPSAFGSACSAVFWHCCTSPVQFDCCNQRALTCIALHYEVP